ncbi:MAG TPA: phosphate ABC transporter substrate-binding protein PstS [Stellaceae bacterium]|nr:phosphate ABC transporter substrate-binding protein PstS [Stellaceae bacterium]
MTFIAKRLFGAAIVAAVAVAAAPSLAADISGAGATFPYPVYAKWAEAYKAKTGIGMNYQSIGSGGGIKQIQAKTVDFGASDKPLDPADLDKSGLIQWPQIMGGVVAVVNVKGIGPGQLKLTGPLLADIYLGKITKWNDKALTAINPGVKLPDLAIAPVYRSDGSGTTYNYTYYLAEVSPEWKDKVGVDTSVQFPTGLGGKGNEGVSAFTSQTDGAIGYVEYAYALQNKLAYTLMQNKDGVFVSPNSKSFQAAAANADWKSAPGFKLILANQPGKDSWPMTASSFILLHKVQDKPETGKAVLTFFDDAFKNGKAAADALDYVSLPDNVVSLIETTWKTNVKDSAGKPVWP